jgi:hypothetical protein
MVLALALMGRVEDGMQRHEETSDAANEMPMRLERGPSVRIGVRGRAYSYALVRRSDRGDEVKDLTFHTLSACSEARATLEEFPAGRLQWPTL